jgi:hypothetical protein
MANTQRAHLGKNSAFIALNWSLTMKKYTAYALGATAILPPLAIFCSHKFLTVRDIRTYTSGDIL